MARRGLADTAWGRYRTAGPTVWAVRRALRAVSAGAGVWLTIGLIGLGLTLLVAGLVGWAADQVIPGRLPGGAGWARC